MEHMLKKIIVLAVCAMALFTMSGFAESVIVTENAEDAQNADATQDNTTPEIPFGTKFKTIDGNHEIYLKDFSTTVNAEKQSHYTCSVSIVMTNVSHDIMSM